MIVLYCWILNYLVLNVYFSGTVLRPIGDVTMTKCHQQLNEILSFFLPALHPGNQQSCLQENLSRNTLVELYTILCDQHALDKCTCRLHTAYVSQRLSCKQLCWFSGSAGKKKKKNKISSSLWWHFVTATSAVLFCNPYHHRRRCHRGPWQCCCHYYFTSRCLLCISPICKKIIC